MSVDNDRAAWKQPSEGSAGDPSPRTQTERWINEARAGSSHALGRLLEGCRKYLLLVANQGLDSDLRPKAGASDLVQDTFFDVQRGFSAFRGSTEAELLAWVRAIMDHRLANHARRYRGTHKRDIGRELPLDAGDDRTDGQLADADRTPATMAAAHDDEARLQAALARLPETLRRVLLLRNWERATFREIGEIMNASPDTVRKQWGRAVRLLGRELRKQS
ncbi:MAG: sigma-70 family RNA polymerase sigma factor [Planctomycetia bacterium]|nr:sigma-70 family RNA polymerase sigma factor [Planctomycetia bacterium]